MGVFNTQTNSMSEASVMPQVIHQNALTKNERIRSALNLSFNLLELAAIGVVFVCLYFYRLSREFEVSLWHLYGLSIDLPRFLEYSVFLLIVAVLWVLWAYKFKLLHLQNNNSIGYFEEVILCMKAIGYSILIAIGLAFLFKFEDYSRLVILSFGGVSITILIFLRGVRRFIIYRLARKGLFARNVVVVGAGKIGRLISEELVRNYSYRLIGFVDDHKKSDRSIKVLGNMSQIKQILQQYSIDEIILTIPSEKDSMNQFIKKYRKYNITIRVVPEMFNLVSNTVEINTMNSIPYITLVKTPLRGASLVLKRSIDILLSGLGLLILSPFLLVVAVLVRLDSPGDILFKQKRVGKDGKFFSMYKFRSMVSDAEKIKENLLDQNEVEGKAFKIKNDPRVTTIGKFLRKYSIDELPQLLNVLKGDMSIVGPRPPLPSEVEQYSDWEWRRLEIVPGITGLWQVSGRSELSFDQWVNLDIYYIENWSVLMDIKILLKTIPVVIKGEGAY